VTSKPSYEELERRVQELEREIFTLKQAEEVLRKSERRYRSLVETSSDWLWEIDANARYTYVNSRLREIFDYSPEEVLGRTPFDLMPEEEARRVEAIFSEIAEERRHFSLLENVNVRRDGRRVVLETSGVPVFGPDGEFTGYRGMDRDVTERKRTEEALKESERKFRAIFDQTFQLMGLLTVDGRLIDANRNALQLAGVRESDVTGRLFWETPWWTHSAEYQEMLREAVKKAAAGEFVRFETTHCSSGGNLHCMDFSLKPIMDDSGGVTFLIAESRDINERRKAEQALRDSETRLRTITDSARDAIIMVGPEGEITYWNPAAERIFGYTREEACGQDLHRLLAPPRYHAAYREAFPGFMETGQGEVVGKTFELVARRKDGEEIPIEVSLSAVFLGGWQVVGLLRDITERKQAEAALRESQQKLADIIDFLPDATFVIDRDGKVIAWNRAMEEMTEVKAADILGKGDYEYAVPFYGERRPIFIDLLDAGDEELESRYKNAIKSEGVLYAETYVPNVYGRKGAYFFETAAPLYDAHGNRAGGIESLRDVTEQKRAEEALKRSEEKYRELVENANSIILRMDTMGHVTFVNEFAQRFFGYGAKELLGRNAVGTIVPQFETTAGRDLELMIEDIGRNPGCYASKVTENMRRCGERVWVAWTNKPLMDEKGRVTEILCVGNDITERKQAEEALKRANILLSTQKETSIYGILAVDENDAVISSNHQFEEMWGFSQELMESQNDGLLVLAAAEKVMDPQAFLERVKDLYADRNETSLDEIALKDGRTFERYSAPMNGTDGKYYGRVSYFRDITERKLMEKTIAEAEAKYRDIFENSVTGIFQTSPEGRFLSVNASIAHVLGYDSTEELIDSVIQVPRLYVHAERRSEMLRLIEKHGWVREFEVEYFRKDKSVVWVSLNARAVRNSTGEIAYIEGTAIDITDRKLLQSQLEQAQKMEAIGTLAGGIAHDFNNILTPIIGYTELSMSSVPEESRLRHNMDQVLLCANRAKELVRQILTFSRKTQQERKLVQISLVIEEALKLVRSLLPSTIHIRHSIQRDAVESTAVVDPTQIQQVLINLCTNAEHAMRAKGGTLSVVLANVDIEPGAARGSPDLASGAYLKLSVSDTGHGMDEAVKQRIFDPYFTTKGPNEGTGLGLAVVYGIVRGLSGAITVSSKPGKGTTFDVYFPRVKVAQVPASELSGPLPTGHGRVLVVDDEKSIGDMIRDMLVNLGYEAVSTHSSTDALAAFRARPESFDLIVTDLTMPHMTGIDLARQILTIRPHIPIILCTGFSDTVDVNRIKLLGIKELLMKPVSMHELAIAADKFLQKDLLFCTVS
jgi:PAS domain S-box-containing protein